jgi:hypothetical protein
MMRILNSLVLLVVVLSFSRADAGTIFNTDFRSESQTGRVGPVISMGGMTNDVTVSMLIAGAGVVGFQINSASTADPDGRVQFLKENVRE